jgi:hypothetical protein
MVKTAQTGASTEAQGRDCIHWPLKHRLHLDASVTSPGVNSLVAQNAPVLSTEAEKCH